MSNPNKLTIWALRLGLAATYVYSGLSLLFESTRWRAFVPFWFADLLPVDIVTYLQVQGAAELILAAAFIFGVWLRPAAFLSALEMLLILVLSGLDGVTFRDLAIVGGSLAVFFSTFAPPEQSANADHPQLVTAPSQNLSDRQKRLRTILTLTAFGLFSIIFVGLFWLSTTTRDQAGWLMFSYATGLSMIVLPCTLPLAFVIVPLAMGKDPKKGLAIALAFAFGVTITLSIYGAIIAKLGQVVGLDRAKDIMYLAAGGFAVIFGLGELGLIKLRVPTYGGAFPKFIQQRKDIGKGFLLGLLLGNVGLGCPNPAFYVLLSHIATVGSMGTGWFLTFVHAVGRVTPLLLLAVLAVLGVDALSGLMKRKDVIARATAWGVVGVGAFILTFGLLGHDWYVYSGIHSVFEMITQEAAFMTRYAEQFGGLAHIHEIPSGPYLKYGSWLMVTLIVIPLLWSWWKKRQMPDKSAWKWMGAFTVSFAVFFYLLFGITLPNWFRYQVAPAMMHEDEHMDEHMDEVMHEEDLEIRADVIPASPRPGQATTLEFQVVEPSSGGIITDLDISHGKPMHVVGVRKEDVSNFVHIHPELKGEKYVVDYTFPEAGTYALWPEIVYQGHEVIEKVPIVVGTPPIISFLPAFDRTLRLDDDLVVSLKGPTEFVAGQESLLGLAVTDAGGFDIPLGKYLEENAHITIVSQDLKHFHHLHANYGEISEEHESGGHTDGHSLNIPLVERAHAHGGIEDEHAADASSGAMSENDLRFRFAFLDPDFYKVFMEFVLASDLNKVHRAEYWVRVKEGLPAAPAPSGFNPPKWALALISLIIIAAVMPLIRRYLREDKIKV